MKTKVIKISIIGRTNAGKSTLINLIVGEKISIQNKKINTTQDLILGIKNIKNTQLIFYDTPGSNFLKSTNKNIRQFKINLWSGIDESDLILYLVDSKTININFLNEQLTKLQEINKDIIMVFNKTDLVSSKKILPYIDILNKNYKINSFFSISAKKNIGIKFLIKKFMNCSYPSNWIYEENQITDKDDKYIFGELLRETILSFLHKEIPYNLKIKTTQYKVLKNNDVKIKQKIIINVPRYKKIILGKKGQMIKRVREVTQNKISKIINKKTHLYIEILNHE